MNKSLLIFILAFLSLRVGAQNSDTQVTPLSDTPSSEVSNDSSKIVKPLGRVKSATEKNSESSSFNPDPDNIDPLNPRNENLKDDEEPVLDDIKQVLDAPKKSKKKKTKAGTADKEGKIELSDNDSDSTTPARKTKKRRGSRNADDPDMALEKKFNKIYNTYNKNPTPDDVWALASSKQTAQKYTVQKGDTLWSISKILFGDPNFWPKLWSLNKQGILNPHFISPKANIYFFSGDEDNSPTLSVGDKVTQPPPATEGGATNLSAKYTGSEIPNPIPDSIPLTRNEAYFNNQKRDIKIQFDDMKVFPLEYANDIYITDAPLKTNVKIQLSEVAKFRCYDGRLLKSIKYIGKLEPEYDVFEKLESITTSNGKLASYRYYGSAEPYEERYLKLTNCHGLIATDLVFLPKGKIQEFRTQKISPSKVAKIIGGPEIVEQKLFILNQIIFVDFGSFEYEPGQVFKVMSRVTDTVNGQIKIIEKYGSYAVVIIDEINDVMAVGDRVIVEQ
jgi:LysM repeat protein